MAVYQDTSDTGLRGPVPRDARLIALILSSMGVSDVEPAVLLQLLEFAHRYTYDVLSDALVYSDHANSRQAGSNLSLDDVNLAIQSRVNYSFTKPPEKDMLLALASTVNAIPLPPISDRHGVRLPPPQHCLTNVNFGIVPNPPPEDFDDFEAEPVRTLTAGSTATNTGIGGVGGASQQTVGTSTQNSSLFDSHSQPSVRRTMGGEEDDYDNDDADDDGDVSMTTIHPSQSQSQPPNSQNTPSAAVSQAQQSNPIPADANTDTNAQRGIKRSLDEDQDYD